MAKGISIKFSSYDETVDKLLTVIKFGQELKKHGKIVLKPHLDIDPQKSTPAKFTQAVLDYCLMNKSPEAEIYIAEGADGIDTMELFERDGYRKIAEQTSVGLIDLNTSEVEEVIDGEFAKFQNVKYPKILFESFVITLPKLMEDQEKEMIGALSIMVGAYPSRHYAGFFSNHKNKIKKWPIKYAIHDSLICKMPEFSVIDASQMGVLLAGVPLEMDKQAAKLIGKDWRNINYLKLIEERMKDRIAREATRKENEKAEAGNDGQASSANQE